MLRWGILSTAKIGIEQLIPAILSANNSVITAIASRDLSRATDVAEQFGVPNAFGSYEDMLESDLVDAIYIPLVTASMWSGLSRQPMRENMYCAKNRSHFIPVK